MITCLPDIPPMLSKFAESYYRLTAKGNASLPLRLSDGLTLETDPLFGKPFAQIFRHSDTPFLSIRPGRRFSGLCRCKSSP